MRIDEIFCRNFRNLENLKLSDFEDMNIICGENGQGKTNILEAIWIFTGAKSFRGSKDFENIMFGKEKAEVSIKFTAGGINNDARVEIKDQKQAQFNGNKLKNTSSFAGKFNAIVFSPADLSLVKDGPAIRRRFLDIAIGQLYPSYIGILREYTRAVIQRNRIIKDYKYDSTLSVMLDVFEKEIAENGIKIIKARERYIGLIKGFLPDIYGGLSGGKENLDICYVYKSGGKTLSELLKDSRKTDIYTGSTSVGPHRDDIDFKINGISARIYGSQGQKRSAALAVKLAEGEVLKKISGEYPVFLLDDVMSELDPGRQKYILNHIKGIQSFITCCDPSDTAGLKKGKIIGIKNGSVI